MKMENEISMKEVLRRVELHDCNDGFWKVVRECVKEKMDWNCLECSHRIKESFYCCELDLPQREKCYCFEERRIGYENNSYVQNK